MGRQLRHIAAVFLLAGCSWTGGTEEDASANVAVNGVDYRQRVADMQEDRRNALFLQAIIGAGLPCQQVEGATPGRDKTGAPAWNVRCRGGEDRTVAINPDGTARILDADPPAPPAPAGNGQ